MLQKITAAFYFSHSPDQINTRRVSVGETDHSPEGVRKHG